MFFTHKLEFGIVFVKGIKAFELTFKSILNIIN